MINKKSFLISGPGLIGTQHADLLAVRSDSQLTAVVAPISEESQVFSEKRGARLYESIDEALAKHKIDAAIISSPNSHHFSQAASCIARGVPTLVEKPMTDCIEDARKLMNLAEASNVPLLVGHHRTYSPLLTSANDFLKSENFGRIVAIQGSALFYKPTSYFRDGAWRTRIGGGPILINLIHEIGIMRHFGGEIKSVFAFASNNSRKFEVEDTVSISIDFCSGALGSFILSDVAASSKSWEMTSGENPAYPNFPKENCYHFVGTRGSLDFPSMRVKYYPHEVDPSWWVAFHENELTFTPCNPLELQLAHFIKIIQGDDSPRVSARDGYLNMLALEAIRHSIKSKSIVDIASMERELAINSQEKS